MMKKENETGFFKSEKQISLKGPVFLKIGQAGIVR
jgi:hypothetical protein